MVVNYLTSLPPSLHPALSLPLLSSLPKTFANPRDPHLLPDMLPPPYQKPYTLVLELNDILIFTEYDVRQTVK